MQAPGSRRHRNGFRPPGLAATIRGVRHRGTPCRGPTGARRWPWVMLPGCGVTTESGKQPTGPAGADRAWKPASCSARGAGAVVAVTVLHW